jgi:hypothetical protein
MEFPRRPAATLCCRPPSVWEDLDLCESRCWILGATSSPGYTFWDNNNHPNQAKAWHKYSIEKAESRIDAAEKEKQASPVVEMVPPAHMEQHLRQVIYARHKLAERRYDDQTLTQNNFQSAWIFATTVIQKTLLLILSIVNLSALNGMSGWVGEDNCWASWSSDRPIDHEGTQVPSVPPNQL